MDDPGPTGVVVSRNIMDNIAYEGVHFHNTLFNSTGFNVFYDVGNGLGATAVSPIIHMETDQCISVGDLFQREDETLFPRIALLGNGGICFDGTHSIHLGSYERQVGVEAQLAAGDSGPIFTNSNLFPNSYRVDYTIKDVANSNARMGTITVSTSGDTVTYEDEYTESGSLGIELDVEIGRASCRERV